MSNVKALELVNISLQYSESREPTLKNINLSVNQGEVAVIYGHNGSGKSTLLNVIGNRIYSKNPLHNNITITGDIFIGGEKVEKNFPYEKISYSSQHREGADFHRVIGELSNNGQVPEEKINEITDFFRCRSLLKKRMISLSGGQRQLVYIMKVFLSPNSDIIMLDEPINNLDRTRAVMLNNYIIDFIKRNPTKAIIIVTHCRMFSNVTPYNLDRGVLTPLPKDMNCTTCFGETDKDGYYEIGEGGEFHENEKSGFLNGLKAIFFS